jgi:hypothetical protein
MGLMGLVGILSPPQKESARDLVEIPGARSGLYSAQ